MQLYKRCPACNQMNRHEASECYECGAFIPEVGEAPPVGDPRLASVRAEKLTWDLSVGSLIQQSVELYFRTFPRLLILLVALTATCFGYLLLSVFLLAMSGWFMLLVAPVGLVLACSFWSGHLCLLVDAVRGNARPIHQLVMVGFLRGINLAMSMMMIYAVLFCLTLALTVSMGSLGMLPLAFLLFMLSVWAFPYLPVIVLENRGPMEALFRAIDLTESFRLNIFFLMCLNVLAAFLLQTGTLAIMGGANAVLSLMGPEDIRALIPLTLGFLTCVIAQVVMWSMSTVMAFVVFWKRTNGDRVGLFL